MRISQWRWLMSSLDSPGRGRILAMDNVSLDIRSKTMAAVRSAGNRSTEGALRARLVRAGIRGWRLNGNELPGCPDFVFGKCKLAVFVDGCFWHGCPKCGRLPSSNTQYWVAKVGRNKTRDKRVSAELRREGWHVVRIWEHQLRKSPRQAVDKILGVLLGT